MSARRRRRGLVRRHWITGALASVLVGLLGYAGMELYQVEIRLREVRAERLELEELLQEERIRNQSLARELAKVSSDPYMEYLAKEMGFIYPDEMVYQKGTSMQY